MISVASLENSRRLHEVSDWDNAEYEWVITHYGTIEAWNSCETSEFEGRGDKVLNVPAYDLSFLLNNLNRDPITGRIKPNILFETNVMKKGIN